MIGWCCAVGTTPLVVLARRCAAGRLRRAPHAPTVGRRGERTPEDRVGIDDTFDVRVYGEPELTGTFRVATDGTVDYPLAGRSGRRACAPARSSSCSSTS